MTIRHDWKSKHLLVLNYTENITGKDMLDSALQVGGDPRYDDLHFIITDWSRASGTNISKLDIQKLVAIIGAMTKSNGRIHNISVVPPNTDVHQAAQAYCDFMTQYSLKTSIVFSFEDALDKFPIDKTTLLRCQTM